ncbi:MAG TPA: FtsK/SpoIIIE domain-containing protein [Streptosporangiaceae bacterium]|nr:FtsK/SpoIIIE domain-containing protein [Streptosporangiaceae bacterium]
MSHRDPYRRYRRDMRRAFRGRRGGYPVLFPAPYEPWWPVVAAAVGRWAYRHRSAFLPFLVTAAAFIAAAELHHGHRAAWPVIAGITGLAVVVLGIPHRILWTRPAGRITAGLLARTWEKCGIDRPAERAYVTAIIAVSGGWLAAATALSPVTKPLPQVAVISTVVLGIPWWAHRRRRAKVRALRTIQTWPAIAENMGLPGSRITSIVVDVWGWTARVALRKGTTAAHAVNQVPAIESGLGLRPGSARVIPDPAKADRFILRVAETDPHAQPIPWPGTANTSITKPVTLGLSEDGQTVAVLILRRNVLIGGTTGAGKSGILNIILAVLVACPDVVIWGVDLKGGMELQPWAACLGRPLATTPQEANELFRDAVAWVNHRAARMAAYGKRVWEPSPDNPALVIVVDEYAELPEESHDCADSIARRGRAVAVNLIAATQRPTQAAMGKGAVRSQMDVRICLRVRERRDVDLILGQGAFTAGWYAHVLTQSGAFLFSAPEHTVPERYRAYLVADDQVTRQATTHTHTRPWLPARPPSTHHDAPRGPQDSEPAPAHAEGQADPEMALWDALVSAGPDGTPVAELMTATGMGRRWVYYRLRELASTGRAVQTIRGHWRAVPGPAGPPGGRPPSRPPDGRPPGRPRRPRGDRE